MLSVVYFTANHVEMPGNEPRFHSACVILVSGLFRVARKSNLFLRGRGHPGEGFLNNIVTHIDILT